MFIVLEGRYKTRLIKKLENMFPGCMILKNDASYQQGVPDLIILWREHWAMLEVKRSKNADHQPNQDYFIRLLDGMSFAAFIYPENEEEILDGLQQAFQPEWDARIPQRQ
jgi:hypothetical protein